MHRTGYVQWLTSLGSSLALLVLLAATAQAENNRTIVETKETDHITVMGQGYLLALDEDGKQYFVRSCVAVENENGQLCCKLGKKYLPFDPTISIPQDSLRMTIDPNGRVFAVCLGSEHTPTQVGSLSVAQVRFRDAARELQPGIYTFDDRAAPTIRNFGEESKEFLMQGYIEKPVLNAHTKNTKKRNK